jgi:hypothetical protein
MALCEVTARLAELLFVRVRDGVDSYLIEGGKIVAQTIHYTLETP